MLADDDLIHAIKQIARDDHGSDDISYWGYVSSYDPNTNSVQVTLPALRTGDQGNFVTPPIPLGTWMSGNSYGAQYYPPPGTPCEVVLLSRTSGTSIATVHLYNESFPPPFPDLQSGEFGWMHESGSSTKYTSDGSVSETAAANYSFNTSGGSYSVNASAGVTVTGPVINMGGSSPLDFGIKGTTFLTAENALQTALSAANAAALLALSGPPPSPPPSAVGQIVSILTTLLGAYDTAITAWQATFAAYSCTILKVV